MYMGAYSRVSIKIDHIDTIIKKIEKSFKIGRKEFYGVAQDYYFYDIEKNSGRNAFIISQDSNLHWVDVVFPFPHLYYFDEFLRRLSKELDTEILLGYDHDASGEARVAKFSQGALILSIYQQPIMSLDRIILVDDYGVEQFKEFFKNLPKLYENFKELLDLEDIQEFFIYSGRTYEYLGDEYEEYLHLEWLI